MRVLVTGGAGYIGSVVASQLVEAGHETVVFDDLSKGHRGAVPEGARLVHGNLMDAGFTHEALSEGFDGVLHFAALSLVGESVERPEIYYRNNVCGTLNLLEAMREAGTGRLVFSSTAAVYGEPEEVPIQGDGPDPADQSVRELQARGRQAHRRRLRGPWAGRDEPPLLQRGGRERPVRGGPRS